MIERAVILSTGDEITTGKVVDSNSNYIADRLNEIGVDLVGVITVGDVPERLQWAWRTAMEMAGSGHIDRGYRSHYRRPYH